jgi:hypothetical protein
MFRRPLRAGLGLILALSLAPSLASAQLGGITKKVKEKVVPAAPAGAGQPSTDQPARLPGPEITPSVVDRFLAGLKAEKGARDRAAEAQQRRQQKSEEEEKQRQEEEKQRQLEQMDPQTRHVLCVNEKQQQDPKYAQLQKLASDAQAASNKGDNNKAMEVAMQMGPLQQEIQQRADSICTAIEAKAGPTKPTPAQKAIQNAPEAAPEDTAAKVAGMTAVEYGQVKELIYTYLNYGKRAGVTEQEKQAIEAKRPQLKEAFKAIGVG